MPGTPSARRDGPDPAALLPALATLQHRGDPVSVVRLVERWAEEGAVPPVARVAEARAFLALCQVDRAWMQLKAVLAAEPEHADALALLTEVFARRGWASRAQDTLVKLAGVAPRHPELDGLRARVAAAAPATPAGARDIERDGTPEQVLGLAEHYLATGSVLRAQSLLERLRRGGAGDDPRVEALLWGIRGEFLDRPGSTRELVESLVDQGRVDEWDGPDRTEAGIGAPEHTQEVGRGGAAGGRGGPAFPSLFRREGGDGDEMGEEDDVTMASVMAGAEDLADPPTREDGDAQAGPDDGGFEEFADSTEILDVIPQGGGGGPGAPAGADPLRRPLDLRSLQIQDEPPATEDSWVEDDDGLVVLTRREPLPDPDTAPDPGDRPPIEVIEKVPVPPPLPEGLPGEDEDTPPVQPAIVPPLEDAALGEPSEEAPARRGRPLWPLAVAVGVVVGLAGWLGFRNMKQAAVSGVVDEVHGALAVGDARALGALAATLQEQLDAGASPRGVLAAELALVQAVRFDEATGDPADRAAAAAALEIAASGGAPAFELGLARSALAWADGDLRGAADALVASDGPEPIRDHLAARVALALGADAAARAAWTPPAVPRDAPRLASLGPGVASLDGDAAAAEATAALAGAGPVALVPALAEGWVGSPPAGRLAAIERLLEGNAALEPRPRGRLLAARVDLLRELGRASAADAALKEAVKEAGRSPEVRYRVGADALARGAVRSSLEHFEACRATRRFDAPCARGAVQALLELDRLDEAAALVLALPEGDLRAVLGAWVSAERGEPGAAAADIAPWMEGRRPAATGSIAGLARYVAGIVAVEADDATVRGQGADALARSARLLRASGDPLDAVTATRASALRVRLLGAQAPATEVDAAASADPVALLHLAARAEALGSAGAARSLLDRAARSAPESARVHHARGLLAFSPATMDEARTAWRRYLDLGPTGPRADRVRERIGP